jgi:hypothetical protein
MKSFDPWRTSIPAWSMVLLSVISFRFHEAYMAVGDFYFTGKDLQDGGATEQMLGTFFWRSLRV